MKSVHSVIFKKYAFRNTSRGLVFEMTELTTYISHPCTLDNIIRCPKSTNHSKQAHFQEKVSTQGFKNGTQVNKC